MSRTIVEFKDVVKVYGKGDGMQIAVNHVDFTIEEGEFVVILGQSGAGKSTILNMLGGMDQPTSGKVNIDGMEVSAMNDRHRGVYLCGDFLFELPKAYARGTIRGTSPGSAKSRKALYF